MKDKKFVLAIDQGTSSTKVLIFDAKGSAVAKGFQALKTSYYPNGFVEQDPEDIYQNVLNAVQACVLDFTGKGFAPDAIESVGISNQRETFIVWDKNGQALDAAVVWQCKRSVPVCDTLRQRGLAGTIQGKTGLVIDPYFSATKLMWLNQNKPSIRSAIRNREAYFGTIDSWLLFKLTNGQRYLTDHTNASRTMLFNIHTLSWDDALISEFGLSGIQLPKIGASSSYFGESTFGGIFKDPIPICSMIGDSHAAAFGEGCFDPGTAKATLGTGSSILMNIGNQPLLSDNGMVTTINWSTESTVCYGLEGVIVSCGATIDWLRNELELFTESKETESMAKSVTDNGGVYLIPAFSGLGSPHWQMDRKASITGLSFGSTKNHIVRAALESIPFQIKDVITAMEKDTGLLLRELRTNGGLTSNNFVMQLLADLLEKPVHGSAMSDVSALGAAYMAGLKSGIYSGIDFLRTINPNKNKFIPQAEGHAHLHYQGWVNAIEKNV